MEVRRAVAADLDFLVHCALTMAHETENKTLDETIVRPGIMHCLEDETLGCYYVCLKDGKSVGVTMLTYEMSVEVGGQIHWIQSVYVSPDARKQGVFRSLYEHICAIAKEDPLVKCVRLYVETENVNAQKVYEALGMNALKHYDFDEVDFVLGH